LGSHCEKNLIDAVSYKKKQYLLVQNICEVANFAEQVENFRVFCPKNDIKLGQNYFAKLQTSHSKE